MDLTALQTTLREFAAERDWQPFHTPKNLVMALLVEAAELAEIFQWMTPEQSAAVAGDVVLRERVADEVADVLLYLVQVADHSGVDLKRAVGRKLVKNARKHPPTRPGPADLRAAAAGASAAVETHVLVDCENVQPRDDDIRALVPDATDVWLFHGPHQRQVGAAHASFGDRATPVKIARTGKNALDFHLSFYMGYIAARRPDARFVVVSNDAGYAPVLQHAVELGFAATQVGFGARRTAAAAAAATKAATEKVTPAKQATPAKATPAKTATPAKEALAKKATPAKVSTAAKKATPARTTAAVKAPATKATPPTAAAPAQATPKKKPAAPIFTVAAEGSVQPLSAPRVTAPKAADAAAAPDPDKGFRHVLANLRKTTARPARRTTLLARIRSLLGPGADETAAQAVLERLLAGGQVAIGSSGAVRYALSPT